MSKTSNTPDDRSELSVVLDKMRVMEETHRAEREAMLSDIAALKAQAIGRGAIDPITEALAARIESTSAEHNFKSLQSRTDALIVEQDRKSLERYRELLTGEMPYFVTVTEKAMDAATGQRVARPMPGMGRLVYARSSADAVQGYESHMGIADKPEMSRYSDGAAALAIEADAAKADEIRTKCLRMIDGLESWDKVRDEMNREATEAIGGLSAVGVA